jgi:hypothetical protein
MVELGGWFKEKFWTGAGTGGRISTKLITRQLESYLPSDPAGVLPEGGLLRGWSVETRDPLPRIPLLYGENASRSTASARTRSTPAMTATGPCWKSRAAAPSRTTAS